MDAQDSPSEDAPTSAVEIYASHGGTAIGRVANLNMLHASPTAIGSVQNYNLLVQAAGAQRATTSVRPIASMQGGPGFVGRAESLEELSAFLAAESDAASVASISGPPGVGKSALALEAALRAESHFSQALFADLRGYEEAAQDQVRASDLYMPMLKALGVPDENIPSTTGEQATLYHQVLRDWASAGRAALFLLDNASDRGQFEDLIPAERLHKTIVTTRETFPRSANRHVLELGVLSIDEAIDLLAQSIQHGNDQRVDDGRLVAEQLAELCDRLPLALHIVAALVVDEPDRPLREFATELEEEEHRLDNLHYDDRLSVRAAISLSYKRLSDDLQRLFRLMSQVPGGDVGIDAARWLMEASTAAVRPQLMALVRSHLIQQHVKDRWSMHDLVRLYSAEIAATDHEDADLALKRVVTNYRAAVSMACEWLTAVASETTRQVFPTPAHAASWFEKERTTAISIVMQTARRQGYEETVLQFGVVLGDLLKDQVHWRSDFDDVASVTASIVPRVEAQTLSVNALNNFGTVLRFRTDYQDAQRIFEQAASMCEELGDSAGASGTRCNIGNILQEQGRFDEAIAIYRADLKLRPAETHPYPAAHSHTILGAALTQSGRPGEAVTQLLKAAVLCRRLDSRPDLATALLNLGAAYIALSELTRSVPHAQKAANALEESHRISRALHDDKGKADAANNLGVALCSLRMFEEGIRFFEEALEYYDRTDQQDQAARTRWHMGRARKALNRLDNADDADPDDAGAGTAS